METTAQPRDWRPVARTERFAVLDILRGLALLGVLLVNLLSDFRIPLAENILIFHTDAGWANRAVDVGVAVLLEFKAMTIFSFLFGVGSAIFAERAASRGVAVTRFLVRRYLVLLLLGLCHLFLIWNGDILTLYAICAFLLLPFLRLPTPGLAAAGIAAIVLTFLIPWGFIWPGDAMLHRLAAEAGTVYARGNFANVLAFHWRETWQLILPLLVMSLPRTWGLMALGAATWRAGVFREPQKYRRLLRGLVLMCGAVGGSATVLSVAASSTGHPSQVPSPLLDAGSTVPLALAYMAGLLLIMRFPIVRRAANPFGAVGQMALTNYLTQSVVLSLLFYGYGLGLVGRLGSAAATVIGLAIYACQLILSVWWLRRFRFGPIEWCWRSITYGRRQLLWRGEGRE